MNIKEIKNWFEVAIPEPTIEQACIQIGCHYEEVHEMATCLNDDMFTEELEDTAIHYKGGSYGYKEALSGLSEKDRIELIDSLCDQIVTAIGVAHMLGMDIEGALKEVNRSNHSKFEDGAAVFDDNGKITKGKHCSKPELSKFIGTK